ncbi:MAG: twin-arginine translocase subunit TatB [Bdellovibrio sp.]|nr:MAG: twin-arginine translocase subunit TatB [Bdellovibrio sp.]
MFGIGLSEILVIGIIALVFIGPDQLPAVARSLARLLNELRRSSDEVKRQFQRTLHEPTDHKQQQQPQQQLQQQKLQPQPPAVQQSQAAAQPAAPVSDVSSSEKAAQPVPVAALPPTLESETHKASEDKKHV